MLHHEIGHAIRCTDFVDRADVGVIEPRCALSLTSQLVLRFDDIAGDNLQCHEAVEVEIARGVHDTHPPRTEKALDPVMTHDVSDETRATVAG